VLYALIETWSQNEVRVGLDAITRTDHDGMYGEHLLVLARGVEGSAVMPGDQLVDRF